MLCQRGEGRSSQGVTMAHKVAIALGGNIGDVPAAFDKAIALLEEGGLTGIVRGRTIVSSPVDCVPGTPDFHNSAIVGSWDGSPEQLLDLTQSIERKLGRPAQHSSRESRTLDLDILLFDDLEICTPRLTIPHPRMKQRPFVMVPLEDALKKQGT